VAPLVLDSDPSEDDGAGVGGPRVRPVPRPSPKRTKAAPPPPPPVPAQPARRPAARAPSPPPAPAAAAKPKGKGKAAPKAAEPPAGADTPRRSKRTADAAPGGGKAAGSDLELDLAFTGMKARAGGEWWPGCGLTRGDSKHTWRHDEGGWRRERSRRQSVRPDTQGGCVLFEATQIMSYSLATIAVL
jgi:hypothetical protein